MTLQVQRFLREGGTLDGLLSQYAIKARRHAEFPNLICLKYNQIASLFSEEIVRECRGVILDEADDWRVVARTFGKFFNLYEPHAAQIDWSTARVQEKLDGSLMQLYWYRSAWRVASSGTPDASGGIVSLQQDGEESFASLFWRTFRGLGYELPDSTEFTYAFELMTPFNRVVVRHAESRLVLLGMRSMVTGEEVRPGLVPWPVVQEFPLASFGEVLDSFDRVDPLSQEGYVVVDAAWNRVKVKHPGYVALAHMSSGGCTPRRVMDIVRKGETSEILAHFPEWRPMFDDLTSKFEGLVEEVQAEFERLREIPVGSKEAQKEFAAQANRTRYPAALFQVRSGKASSMRDFFAGVNIDQLLKTLGVEVAPSEETE